MSELINAIPSAAYWLMQNVTIVMAVLIAVMVIYTIGFTRGAKWRA